MVTPPAGGSLFGRFATHYFELTGFELISLKHDIGDQITCKQVSKGKRQGITCREYHRSAFRQEEVGRPNCYLVDRQVGPDEAAGLVRDQQLEVIVEEGVGVLTAISDHVMQLKVMIVVHDQTLRVRPTRCHRVRRHLVLVRNVVILVHMVSHHGLNIAPAILVSVCRFPDFSLIGVCLTSISGEMLRLSDVAYWRGRRR